MAQTVQIYRSNVNTPPAALLPGVFSTELGPQTKLWIGSPSGNRLLLSSDPADISIGSGVIIAPTPPTALPGALWWDSTDGQLYVRYSDGSSTQWVIATSIPMPVLISEFAPVASAGELWWNSTDGQLYVRYFDGSSTQWVIANTVGGGLYLPLGGGALTGPLTLSGDPVGDFDAATKRYVDMVAGGLTAKIAALEAVMSPQEDGDGA